MVWYFVSFSNLSVPWIVFSLFYLNYGYGYVMIPCDNLPHIIVRIAIGAGCHKSSSFKNTNN